MDEVFHPKKYNYKKIVKERKKEYSLYYDLPNYSRLVFDQEIFSKQPLKVHLVKKQKESRHLEGVPCSSGVVKGEALVILDVHKKVAVKDKILITKMTDPGWVFLLATAKGIVSEKGSLLSHTAIISREIGIPSIVGVEDATTIIHTGDVIQMDGTTGKVEILERKKI